MATLESAPLGKSSDYPDQYDPSLLYPVPRKGKREEINIIDGLPFSGVDIWNAWEVSWLNSKGKPQVAVAEIFIPADSENIIESKSLKLYLNSLNAEKYETIAEVVGIIEKDLSMAAGAEVKITLVPVQQADSSASVHHVEGECIDELDVSIDTFLPEKGLLKSNKDLFVTETLYSHLLKSNCPVTGQPDWGTLVIQYTGPKLDRASLLKYIISFRDHNDFHEHCVERAFVDLKNECGIENLTVYARYVRRGGLDINPYRSNQDVEFINRRLVRQ